MWNKIILFTIYLYLGLFCSEVAFAKKVKLEWDEIEGAQSYEIQIEADGKLITKKVVKNTYWKGNLPIGIYKYKIRGLDSENNPGLWTESVPLVLIPPTPTASYPANRADLDFYGKNVSTVLKWDSVPGVKKYQLEVKRNGEAYLSQALEENHFELKKLPEGKYIWSVKGIVQEKGRQLSSSSQKKWTTEESRSKFTVEYKEFDPPRIVYPIGPVFPPTNNEIHLQWRSVSGAEAYEVQVIKTNKNIKDRSIASDLTQTQRFYTRDQSWKMSVAQEGSYVWGVRAIANIGEDHKPQAITSESVAKFYLDKNVAFRDDWGSVAFSTGLSPYNYQLNSPSRDVRGAAQSSGLLFGLEGDYWFWPQWSIYPGFEYGAFQINSRSFSRNELSVAARYRMKWGISKLGWYMTAKFGFGNRDYTALIPNNTPNFNGTYQIEHVYSFGSTLGVDVRRQITQNLSLGARLNYFLPLELFGGGASGKNLAGSPSYRNLTIELNGLYWVSHNWGLSAGGAYEMRSISYAVSNTSSQDQISMDAYRFFGTVVFRFWK